MAKNRGARPMKTADPIPNPQGSRISVPVLAGGTHEILSGEAATQALEEYKSLRTEVLQNEKVCTELLGLTLAFSGIVIGQGITQKSAGIFLILLPLIWSMYFYVTDKRRAAYAASQYIAVYLEPKLPGLKRETRRIALKLAETVVPGERGVVVDWVIFNALYFVCIILFIFYADDPSLSFLPVMIWAGLKGIEMFFEKSLLKLDRWAHLRAGELWRSSSAASSTVSRAEL